MTDGGASQGLSPHIGGVNETRQSSVAGLGSVRLDIGRSTTGGSMAPLLSRLSEPEGSSPNRPARPSSPPGGGDQSRSFENDGGLSPRVVTVRDDSAGQSGLAANYVSNPDLKPT